YPLFPSFLYSCLSLRSLHTSPLFPYTTLFRSSLREWFSRQAQQRAPERLVEPSQPQTLGCNRGGQQHVERRRRHSDFLFRFALRSEEHTSELQSPDHLVCRLLLEKKKKIT